MAIISLSDELQEKIRNLGNAGETYDEIILRMYDATSSNILLSYLYDDADSVPINEAVKEAKRRWTKSE